MMSFRRPRGTQDVLPAQAVGWRVVTDAMRRVLRGYGYGEIRTPVFEDTQLFIRGVGEGTDIVQKEMYTFADRKGRSMTLRPEGTAAVVRAWLESNLGREAAVQRFWYLGPMFRYDRPQAGRFREFFQVGAEVIGSQAPEYDVEIIDLMMSMLAELGMHDLYVQVNSVGGPDSRKRYEEELRVQLRQKRQELCATCQARIESNPLRILDCKNASCQDVVQGLPQLPAFLSDDERAHHEQVLRGLDALEISWKANPRLVRGLDYYTRTAFEVHYPPLGAQSALGGGGRYDGLVRACGGPDTPAVGFSTGIERVLFALQQTRREILDLPVDAPVVVLPVGEAARLAGLRLARQLRRVAPTSIDLTGRSLKAQLRSAGKGDARLGVLLGDTEIQRGEVTLRDLRAGEQRAVAMDDLMQAVRQALESPESESRS
jgi:histidyl-tRNA synthetase